MIKKFVFFIAVVALSACAPQEETPCSSSQSADNTKCAVNTSFTIDSSSLAVTFKTSKFYSDNDASDISITSSDLTSGTINTTIPIYSSTLGTTLSTALSSAQQSLAGTLTTNKVPYIAFTAISGVKYLYRYQKFDALNQSLYEKIGEVTTSGGVAYIPIVNAQFDDQVYTTSATLGTRYKHTISISPQSSKRTGETKKVTFETVYTVANVDFTTTLADDVKNNVFNLSSRWKFYINDKDAQDPNTNFPFFTLTDKTLTPQSTSFDAKVVFKEVPRLEIIQDIFYEFPFQYDTLSLNAANLTPDKVVIDRGNRFYTKTVTLSTYAYQLGSGSVVSDIGYNLTLGTRTLTSPVAGAVITYEALAMNAGEYLNLGFSFNMTQSSTYASTLPVGTASTLLHRPLRPICWALADTDFYAKKEQLLKEADVAAGKYYAICDHKTTTKRVSTTLAASTSTFDNFFDFFSYAPYVSNADGTFDAGHMYGIKTLKLRGTLCFKLLVSPTGQNSYTQKTAGGSNCGSGTDYTWTQVNVEKAWSITDDITKYDSVNGQDILLSSLLLKMRSSSLSTDDYMYFNGEKLTIDASGNQLIRRLY